MTIPNVRNFLLTCYRSLLHREPDASDFDYHMQSLTTSCDYSGVLRSFVDSEEFREKWVVTETHKDPVEEIFYFFHIPKTAGMYFKQFLAANGGEENVFPGYYVKDLLLHCRNLKNYRYFSGHFLGFLDAVLGTATRKATLLRDPVDRAISHYFHYQRDNSLPFHQKIVGRSIKEILSDHEVSGFLCNYQAKYLCTLLESQDLLAHTIEIRDGDHQQDEKTLLDKATRSLNLFECVGVQSDLRQFEKRLSTLWKLPREKYVDSVNVGSNRNDSVISKKEIDLLSEANAVDIELYKSVMDRLNQQQEALF